MRRKVSDSRDYRTVNCLRRTFLRLTAAKAQWQTAHDTTLSMDEFVAKLLDHYQATAPQAQDAASDGVAEYA